MIFTWVILPLLIFLARTTDVALGTVRVIAIYRGKKWIALCLGFFEILIWLTAISVVLKHLSTWVNAVAYAGGFAFGNFVGMALEERLLSGKLLIRIFTAQETTPLVSYIQSKGYGITITDAKGREGPLHILYLIILREDYLEISSKIQALHPKAFYTVEDIRTAKEGVFPKARSFKI